MKAKIEIRIWNDSEPQPDHESLAETFHRHVEHVSSMLSRGYQCGEIIGEGHRGWWDIITEDNSGGKDHGSKSR